MQRFGSGEAALAALPDLARRGGGAAPKIAGAAAAEEEVRRVSELGARHIFWDDEDYPPLLRQVDVPPPLLIMKGDAAMLARPSVAMVGARNASAAACRFARQVAMELGEAGVTVVSGLARGVDTAAHVGALAGRTAAVIASGHDIVFPTENASLQAKIAEEHLLISEFPPGTEPIARQFPARNRIIAGSAMATLVVEAAPKSGSLITARQAGEFGRDVLAVPGSPLDPRAQGCNSLIQDGATLIQCTDDILNILRPIDGRMGAGTQVREADRSYRFRAMEGAVGDEMDADSGTDLSTDLGNEAIIDLIGSAPISIDELTRQSGGDVAGVQIALLELEMAGRLERHAGSKVSLIH
jgi:DNA processing protein